MSGIGGLILDDFELYQRPYRGAPGGVGAVPASAGSVLTSLLAMPTDTMGSLPGNRLQVAAELRVVLMGHDPQPTAHRAVKGLCISYLSISQWVLPCCCEEELRVKLGS